MKFNFLKYSFVYTLLSVGVIVVGIISLYTNGLKLSADFVGGGIVEYQVKAGNLDKLKGKLDEWSDVRTKEIHQQEDKVGIEFEYSDKATPKAFEQILVESDFLEIKELRYEMYGPILGRELIRKTAIALLIGMMLILAYIAWTFGNWKFGLAAMIATVHDSLVLIGLFSIMGKLWNAHVDTLFVTALLTVLSFSVHDTIVVFDRIRELKGKEKDFTLVANRALNETMRRSINNSLTIVMMLTCMLIWGGESIRWFVSALLVGTVSGTYSSPFVAVPFLVWIEKKLRSV